MLTSQGPQRPSANVVKASVHPIVERTRGSRTVRNIVERRLRTLTIADPIALEAAIFPCVTREMIPECVM